MDHLEQLLEEQRMLDEKVTFSSHAWFIIVSIL